MQAAWPRSLTRFGLLPSSERSCTFLCNTLESLSVPGYEKFNDLWILQKSTWTSLASPWEPRSGLQAMVLNQSLLVMGGNGKYVQDMYNDVWSLPMSLGLGH